MVTFLIIYLIGVVFAFCIEAYSIKKFAKNKKLSGNNIVHCVIFSVLSWLGFIISGINYINEINYQKKQSK